MWDASACVTRQYTGTAGKVTNCQTGVSPHLASNGASAAVNWRLFLRELGFRLNGSRSGQGGPP
jgi:SRSO17 transposase